MEHQPPQSRLAAGASLNHAPRAQHVADDWRDGLSLLAGQRVRLREVRQSDAASLLEMVGSDDVARFISAPATTREGFSRFITWAQAEREAGRYACFTVIPKHADAAIGLFQLRQLDPWFSTAEWGFALASPFWGTGIFAEAATLVIDFAFDVIGVHRLEARAATENRRGNGALRKLGAVPEGVLRHSFFHRGRYCDQRLWSIVEADRWQAKAAWGPIPSLGRRLRHAVRVVSPSATASSVNLA